MSRAEPRGTGHRVSSWSGPRANRAEPRGAMNRASSWSGLWTNRAETRVKSISYSSRVPSWEIKRALSLTEQPSGAQLSRAPSQAGPNAEPGTGKSDINSSDQNWWRISFRGGGGVRALGSGPPGIIWSLDFVSATNCEFWSARPQSYIECQVWDAEYEYDLCFFVQGHLQGQIQDQGTGYRITSRNTAILHCYKLVARNCLPNHCRRAGAATGPHAGHFNINPRPTDTPDFPPPTGGGVEHPSPVYIGSYWS